jgi:hypothetical protein
MNRKKHDENPWGKGAERAAAFDEGGNPEKWLRFGLDKIPHPWMTALGPFAESAAAIKTGCNPADIARVLGGACIYRCGGVFNRLPLGFLWEVLTVAMCAKVMKVEGIVSYPIAEECRQQPQLEAEYKKLGEKLTFVTGKLGETLGIKLSAFCEETCYKPDDITPADLYGLFFPFSDSPQLQMHPRGEPGEEKLIDAFASYCASYRYPPGGLRETDLVVGGIHLAKSVLLGLGGKGTYLATVPFPSFEDERCMMVDHHDAPTLGSEIDFPDSWWPDGQVKKILGHSLASLLKMII